MLLLALLVSSLFAAPSDDGVAFASADLKRKLFEQINRDRQAEGRPPVEYSEALSRAADAHCREMLEEDYMSHWNRAGWKPYVRYAAAGIYDATQENVSSVWASHFDRTESQVWNTMLTAHNSFLAEKPPNDGHRRSVLDARNTRVGIGVAYSERGLRLIEVFGARYAELEPMPLRATLRDAVEVKGRVLKSTQELMAVAVYYEPPPAPMTRAELKLTYSYGLPKEEQTVRPALNYGIYGDGTSGSIAVDRFGRFSTRLSFWKGKPGIYTVVVWVKEKGTREGIQGAMASVIVQEKQNGAGITPLRAPNELPPPPIAP
jgi:uncharacterized protein YkwD